MYLKYEWWTENYIAECPDKNAELPQYFSSAEDF